MKKNQSYFIVGLLIGALLTSSGFAMFLRMQKQQAMDNAISSGNQKINLKLGHSMDVNHPVHKAMEHMKKSA